MVCTCVAHEEDVDVAKETARAHSSEECGKERETTNA